jgi:Amt family ammonium transporter
MVGLVANPAMVVYPGLGSAKGVAAAGLLHGNPGQLLVQLLGLLVVSAYSGAMAVGILKLVSLLVPLRMAGAELEVGDRFLFSEEVFELHHPVPVPEAIEVPGLPVADSHRAPVPG